MIPPKKALPAARLAIGEEQLLLLVAILIGIYSGFAVVCFRLAIEWLRLLLLGSSLTPSFPRVALVPAVSGS